MEYQSLNKLSEDWKDLEEIIVYGFGRVAQRNIKKLKQDFRIKYIIDNNPALGIYSYEGIPVQKLDAVKEELRKYKIIVPTSTLAYDSISKDLKPLGLEEYKDYCRLEEFLPEWYWKYRNQVCVSQIFSTVTSRCTFKCKYCSMLMTHYTEHYDYKVQDIIEDFDCLFRRLDYLCSYYVIGGEPLINKDLPEILETVYEKYGNKIGYMQIITNGSIVPNEELIRVLKKCNVCVRVSDYTHAIPYNKKLQEVINCLKKNDIEYAISKYETWANLGFPEKIEPIGDTKEELRCHMLNCAKGCHSMNDKKLYFCGLLYASEKIGLYQLQPGDYVDLTKSSGDEITDKEEILKYFLGDVQNGYISLCKICRGQGTDNPFMIPVAEQV